MSKLCMGCVAQYDDKYALCPYCGYAENTPATDSMHMEPGSVLQNHYVVGRALGSGGFGVTYIGFDTVIERPIAIKEYLPSEFSTRAPGQTKVTIFSGDKSEQFVDGMNKFIDEARRLALFTKMDGIVNIFDSFQENNTAYIVMELLHGETLADRLGREGKIPIDEAVKLLNPVITSLESVHAKGIIHRDIAPDNIYLTNDGGVKLIDFGAARFATTTHSRSLSVIIKPGYSPEEQYQGKTKQGPYTDVYAISATLYRMITGVVPPFALDRGASLEKKKKDTLSPPSKYCKISTNKENAILNALNIRVEDRTPDLSTFLYELTTEDVVKRQHAKGEKGYHIHWPTWAKIGVPAALVVAAALTALIITGAVTPPPVVPSPPTNAVPSGMSRVPSVINDALDDATARINDAELSFSIVGKEYSSEIPMNLVLKQDINAGTIVEINTVLNITVSGGAETLTMPSVEGLPVDEAKKTLEDLGFAVTIKNQYSTLEKGAVISQSVQSGAEYEVGGTVVLTVSAGADPATAAAAEATVTVPDFVGMTYADALAATAPLGIILSVSREYSAAADKDRVISQGAPAGSAVAGGSTVEITVSLGAQTVTVSDVQFRTEAEAISMLEGQGISANITYENSDVVASGVVISQEPPAGALVEPGSAVDVVVSSGKKTAQPQAPTPTQSSKPSPTPSPSHQPSASASPSQPPPEVQLPSPPATSTPPPPTSQPGDSGMSAPPIYVGFD